MVPHSRCQTWINKENDITIAMFYTILDKKRLALLPLFKSLKESFYLADLLNFAYKKYPELERNLILKSLVYFDDVTLEKILFKNKSDITFEAVKDTLRSKVKELSKVMSVKRNENR